MFKLPCDIVRKIIKLSCFVFLEKLPSDEKRERMGRLRFDPRCPRWG